MHIFPATIVALEHSSGARDWLQLTENFKSHQFNLCATALRSHSNSAGGFIFNGFRAGVPDVSKRGPDSVQALDYFWCMWLTAGWGLKLSTINIIPLKVQNLFHCRWNTAAPACQRGLAALLHPRFHSSGDQEDVWTSIPESLGRIELKMLIALKIFPLQSYSWSYLSQVAPERARKHNFVSRCHFYSFGG